MDVVSREARRRILESLRKGQNPPLVWLYCSDSRVDYNILGTDPGTVFTIENAGNVFGLCDESRATMAYALTHFAVDDRLTVFVMGHTLCGAITTACKGDGHGSLPHPSVGALIRYLEPSVNEARGMVGDVVDNAVRVNVKRQMLNIKEFARDVKGVRAKNVVVYGGVYDISGEDDILPFGWRLTIFKDGHYDADSKLEEISFGKKGSERNIDALIRMMGLDKYLLRH